MEHCIYCGCDKLAPEPGKTFTCPQCGLQLTHDELFRSCSLQIKRLRHRDNADPDKADDYGDEEETLASVWQLMQNKAWEKALTILLPSVLPTEHPMEFAVWRNICRLAPVLPENNLTARCQLFDILQHNLERLDYFISSYQSDKKYSTLQKLYRALMLLGNLDVQCLTGDSTFGNYITDKTNRRRANIIIKLAEVLESLGADTAYGTDYLKMSVRLYSQSLDAAREYCNYGKGKRRSERYQGFICLQQKDLQLSDKTRRYIGDKITQLNAAITQKDAEFIPQEKPPDPKIMPIWLGWLIPISAMAAVASIPFINKLKDAFDSRVLIMLTAVICLILVTAYVVIYSKYDNSGYNRYFDRRSEQPADAAAENWRET